MLPSSTPAVHVRNMAATRLLVRNIIARALKRVRVYYTQVKSFFAEHQDSGIERSTRLEVEQSIVRNIDWMSRSRDDIVNWLRHRQL